MNNQTISRQGHSERRALALTAVWTGVGTAIYLMFPRLAPAVLVLSLIAPLAWYWPTHHNVPRQSPSGTILALLIIGAYLAINATWSLSRSDAYRSILMLFLIIGVLHFAIQAFQGIPRAALRAMAIGSLSGAAVASLFVCFEVWSAQAIHRLVMSWIPALRPDPSHAEIVAGWVVYLGSYMLNRHIALMTMLFWPALYLITLLRPMGRERMLLLGCIVVVCATVLRSGHATSKIALLGSAAVFFAFHLAPLLTRRGMAAGFAATTLLVVPVAHLVFANNLFTASWLAPSAQQRVVIWGYTAQQVAKAPVLGAGVATARASIDSREHAPRAPGTPFLLETGIHSHNAYLQVWYETGAVGALLLLGLGLLVLRVIANEPMALQPYLYAAFTAAALIAGSSFSIWAPWFLSGLALTAVFAALTSTLAKHYPLRTD